MNEDTADAGVLPRSPASPEELRKLVAGLRGLPREELLRLSNAEFGFEESAWIEMLRNLSGDWVVSELGSLAVGETDPLLKAVLVTGLCKAASLERLDDPRMLQRIGELLPQLASAESDSYHAARYLAFSAFGACLRQKGDLQAFLLPHLESSDNPDLLVRGYLFVGKSPGAEDVLARAVKDHSSPDGRLGALEGLRAAGTDGRIPPDEIVRIGVETLSNEASVRNRMLLVEMIGSVGGESGLEALASMVEGGAPGVIGVVGPAASMLAVKMEPEKAQESLEKALASGKLSAADRASVYQALGAVPGDRSRARLLGAVHDEDLPDEERLSALKGLWNRPADAELRVELADLVQGNEPGAIRAESLRILTFSDGSVGDDAHESTSGQPPSGSDERDPASGGGRRAPVDMRRLAEEDRDPEVRREAVVLSALRPDDDSRGWLEERLLHDRSPEVQAAALGALVVQARYTGDGDRALEHLARMKKRTTDSTVLALVARGEEMVSEYDPRRVDLELRKDAEFYRDVAPYTTGAARQAMERQAEYRRRMVEVVVALKRGSSRTGDGK